MKRLRVLPDTLVGQAIVVLLVGLTVSHVISMAVYSSDRVEQLALMGGRTMAQRAANITHLVAEAPPDWRRKLVEGLDEPGFRVAMMPEAPSFPPPRSGAEEWRTKMVRQYVASLLPADSVGAVRVRLIDQASHADLSEADWMPAHMRMMLHGTPFDHRLQVAVRLGDGTWLTFDGAIPPPPSLWSGEAVLSMVLMAVAVVVFTVWVVRRLTRPLRAFAHAAERLGRDVAAPALSEAGPREVRQAAHAFNGMQGRLRRLIENRTRMMAAISHDLRTPITLLRLRTEAREDCEDRDKMLSTLDDMERMIATTLEFVRQDGEREEMRKVDLAALVQSVCDDLADVGQPVAFAFAAPGKILLDGRPLALRRAVANLVENALKYGGRAEVSLEVTNKAVAIVVEDEGPGIPEADMARVFQPFFRIEDSRAPETGGTGLGLSIAQGIAHAHGGDIVLENRHPGLRATLVLPR